MVHDLLDAAFVRKIGEFSRVKKGIDAIRRFFAVK